MKNIKLFSDWSEVTSGERNEIVFEGLNKNYGAYQIRTNYDSALAKSLWSAFSLIGLFSALCLILAGDPPPIIPDTPATRVDPTTIFDPPPVTPQVKPPVTPPVTPPSGPKIDGLTTPVIVDTAVGIDSTQFSFKTPNNGNGKGNDSTGTGTALVNTGGPAVTPVDSTPMEGFFLDVPPSFPGGDPAMKKFLQSNIIYPRSIVEINGTGKVLVSFIVDREGNVIDVTVGKGTRYAELDKEALRVVKKFPKWNPGLQHGNPVKSHMTLPIKFELN